ncbi:MAG TPA: DNA repair protein RecN [Burkholderiaceae bacterium]|nr:DNA repair protein RecN [Burkholderiaceae bacterium]
MLRRLSLRDFVIVEALEVEFGPGFSVLTGETGAGKSILVDALQLALGGRGEALVVREGAPRTEIAAEFDSPTTLGPWLDEAGFSTDEALLLRRTIDAQGKSRAWINGSPATVAQLREAADHLVDIHGQHAWQSLMRPAAVRTLLDGAAGIDPAPLAALWAQWRDAQGALERARTQQAEIAREHERLAWQVGEVEKLAPGADEWEALNAEHQRLSHAQALMDAARSALDGLSEADTNASTLVQHAVDALEDAARIDARLGPVVEVLQGALAQVDDAARSLSSYLQHADLDPERLGELDARLSAWIGLARRFRRPPEALAALLAQWKAELGALDAASDSAALERGVAEAERAWRREAERVSAGRAAAAPRLADAVTQAMQALGMAGGRFEVALIAQDAPQSFGLETVELRVAGHAGATPRALAKVASGGELSRLALAVAVTTTRHSGGAATLIFDEIDAGIGGSVADTVGRLMKQLGCERQVLAVTHLAQVAACGDHHFVVRKLDDDAGRSRSELHAVAGEARVAEIARMLGGERLATSVAHAQELLGSARAAVTPPALATKGAPRERRRMR